MPMHLCVHELSDIVATIGPFENSKAINLTLHQVSPVNKDLIVLFRILVFPLLESFAVHMTVLKLATNLDLPVVQLLYSFAPYFVVHPVSFVFDLFVGLPILSKPMEVTIFKRPCIHTAVLKGLSALSIGEVVRELACVN